MYYFVQNYFAYCAKYLIEAPNNANIDVICIPDMKRPDDNHLSKTLKVFDSLHEVIDFLKRFS